MGVEYSARIVVGLPHEELEDFLEGVEDIHESELDIISPYFDADYCDCLFGVIVQNCDYYSYVEIDPNTWTLQIFEASLKFKDITGQSGRLYLSTYGR